MTAKAITAARVAAAERAGCVINPASNRRLGVMPRLTRGHNRQVNDLARGVATRAAELIARQGWGEELNCRVTGLTRGRRAVYLAALRVYWCYDFPENAAHRRASLRADEAEAAVERFGKTRTLALYRAGRIVAFHTRHCDGAQAERYKGDGELCSAIERASRAHSEAMALLPFGALDGEELNWR